MEMLKSNRALRNGLILRILGFMIFPVWFRLNRKNSNPVGHSILPAVYFDCGGSNSAVARQGFLSFSF
tara:strand:+ start:1498 stop:1701 length:204 start_codon:yes stop_codon:yes gene_type:complete